VPNLNVCTGKAFGTGPSGELVIAGSNNNIWPFSASIASANGLNTDPVSGGLWTAPHGCYSVVQEQIASSLSQALSTTAWPIPTTAYTFTNPSSAAKMRINALVQVRATMNVSAACAGFVTNSCLLTGGTGVRNSTSHLANPTAGTVNGLSVSSWNVSEAIVNPGAVATLTCSHTATMMGAAAVTLTSWVSWVLFTAWLIDPTQAGGVS
jgi:hypothetical protein